MLFKNVRGSIFGDDAKAIRKLGIIVPSAEEYDQLIMVNDGLLNVQSFLVEAYNQRFYVTNSSGMLLYKIKQLYGMIPDTYVIYDAFDVELGKIVAKVEMLAPGYNVNIYGKSNFTVEKISDPHHQDYVALGLHMVFQGDYLNLDYEACSYDGQVLGEVKTKTPGDLLNAVIKLESNDYQLEVICSCACAILSRLVMKWFSLFCLSVVIGGVMELVIKGLKKKFDKKEVLKGVDFSFEKGKIYGLLGRNGAGKTTFFNCINEDVEVDEGEFYIKEKDVRKIKPEDIGYVLSAPNVPEFLTGREFLKFFIEINQGRIKKQKAIDEYFDFMKIDKEDRDKLLKDYSHGMKNKMQMLVNIIASPNILLLDEPLTSFDVVVAEEMKAMLRSIKRDHVIIFSTHIMELALDLCDEIVILNKGVIEKVDKDELDNKHFKEKIIEALKEG